MNTRIEKLNVKLKEANESTDYIQTLLQGEWNIVFKDLPRLRDAISEVESSTEFAWSCDEVVSWIRFDLGDFENCMSYLETYLNDLGINVDRENNVLSRGEGPYLIIYDYGVYDQDSCKMVIDGSDYMNESGEYDEVLRNKLIEAWMEDKGYFPGVFSADRHGNVFAVNMKG